MSARGLTPPTFEIRCDHTPCGAAFRKSGWYLDARYISPWAEEAGWKVRPLVGPGSRSAPDYCPEHASAA